MGTIEDNSPSCVIDIGGGSTEIICGSGDSISDRISLQIGAVRITERFFPVHPPLPAQIKKARKFIREQFSTVNITPDISKVYAVAGTPTTLASVLLRQKVYNSDEVHLFKLNKEDLEVLLSNFLLSTISDIIEKMNIHPKRADVITAGTIILQEFLDSFGFSSCIVSANGLRLGILRHFVNLES